MPIPIASSFPRKREPGGRQRALALDPRSRRGDGRETFDLRRLGVRRLGLGLLLAAGVSGHAWAQAVTQFDGQYSGELTLNGIINGDCTPPPLGALYPLTIAGGQVSYAYTPRFDTKLVGPIAKDGSFRAAATIRRGVIWMTGRVVGNNIKATIESPSCKYTFRTRP